MTIFFFLLDLHLATDEKLAACFNSLNKINTRNSRKLN